MFLVKKREIVIVRSRKREINSVVCFGKPEEPRFACSDIGFREFRWSLLVNLYLRFRKFRILQFLGSGILDSTYPTELRILGYLASRILTTLRVYRSTNRFADSSIRLIFVSVQRGAGRSWICPPFFPKRQKPKIAEPLSIS